MAAARRPPARVPTRPVPSGTTVAGDGGPTERAGTTRARIVAAAGEIFAEHGFRAATIRQITELAGVNLAAVNYHFRDKAELYTQVLQQAHGAALHLGQLTAAAAQEGAAPAKRLRTFVGTFLHYLLDPARPAWHPRVLARELADPTPALDRLVDEAIRPRSAALRDIVRALTGPDLPHAELLLLAQSVLGQCLFYSQCGAVIERVHPGFRVDRPEDIERLADHVTNFSLPAIRAAAANRPRKKAPTSP